MKFALVTTLGLSLSACALFSKGEVPVRRYYSPDLEAAPAATTGRAATTLELRLGRITAGASLDERMVVRDSAQELGFYDDRLWTEPPATYLRRGLARALFEDRGLRSVLRGVAPTIDVELLAFEEVVLPRHLGRVSLTYSLSDERVVSLQRTLVVEQPVTVVGSESEGAAVARALGVALRAAIAEVATQVTTALVSPP